MGPCVECFFINVSKRSAKLRVCEEIMWLFGLAPLHKEFGYLL